MPNDIAPWDIPELAPWDVPQQSIQTPGHGQADVPGMFSAIEQKNELPKGLLDSVWAAESARGKNMGPSSAGAQGHFQFMPDTARRFGLKDPSNLEESAGAAGSYLGKLLKLHQGDLSKAVASYNWGEGNVLKQGMGSMPRETRGYVAKVLGALGNFVMPAAQAADVPKGDLESFLSPGASDLESFLSPQAVLLPADTYPADRTRAEARAAMPPSSDQSALRAVSAEANAEARRQAIKRNPAMGLSTSEQIGRGAAAGIGNVMRGAGQVMEGEFGPTSRWLYGKNPGMWDAASSALGLKQNVLATNQDVADARARNAQLMETPGGNLGAILGETAPYIAAPWTRSILGTAAIGGAMGAIRQHETPEEQAWNTGIGAGTGGAMQAGGALALGAGRMAAGIRRPFSAKGAENVAFHRLESLADNKANLSRPVSSEPSVTGAKPTLAETMGDDVGVARYQDWMMAHPGLGGGLQRRFTENNVARVNALDRIAGTTEDRAADEVARDTAATAAYRAPKEYTMPVSDALKEILGTPTMTTVMKEARKVAMDRRKPFGITFGPDGKTPVFATGQALHDMKMAIDDRLVAGNPKGWVGAKADTAAELRGDLLKEMDAIPGYGAARKGYAIDSGPLNRRDIASELGGKIGTVQDLGGARRLSNAQITRAMDDEAALIKAATGTKAAGSRLDAIFQDKPEELNIIRQIQSEVAREASVAAAAQGKNSATYQRLALSDMLSRTAKGRDFSTSPIAQTMGGIFKILPSVLAHAEPKVQEAALKLFLDPAYTASLAARTQAARLRPLIGPKMSAALTGSGKAAVMTGVGQVRQNDDR